MKVYVSIVMSTLFLFQGMNLNLDFCYSFKEVSKVISHFQDHKVHGDSFIDYIIEDYIGNDVEKELHHNNSGDEDLPVHSKHQCFHSVVLYISDSNYHANSQRFNEIKEQIVFYRDNLSSRFLESPFHPPQV